MSEAEEKITDAELEIMQVLWASEEALTLSQIKSALKERNGETVKTLLRRLCQKEAVEKTKREVFYYRPLVGQEEFGFRRTQRLIDRLYAGSAKAMVAALVENDQLRAEDVDELKELFQELWEGEKEND